MTPPSGMRSFVAATAAGILAAMFCVASFMFGFQQLTTVWLGPWLEHAPAALAFWLDLIALALALQLLPLFVGAALGYACPDSHVRVSLLAAATQCVCLSPLLLFALSVGHSPSNGGALGATLSLAAVLILASWLATAALGALVRRRANGAWPIAAYVTALIGCCLLVVCSHAANGWLMRGRMRQVLSAPLAPVHVEGRYVVPPIPTSQPVPPGTPPPTRPQYTYRKQQPPPPGQPRPPEN